MNKHLLNFNAVLALVLAFVTSTSFSQTYTFTTAGQSGTTGPSQAQVNAAYLGTSLDGAVTVTGGIQSWTVPSTGSYRISAYGAQGGGANGGLGALIEGDFNLTAGQVIQVLVGQQGETQAGEPESVGGGGGSFVVLSPGVATGDILVIAGGGGGSPGSAFAATANGSITNDGNDGVVDGGVSNPSGFGGTAGNGGNKSVSVCSIDRGAGGGGFLTDGESICQTPGRADGGLAFINGGTGGTINENGATGGFGGGGAVWQTGFRGSGGGGGYSGGGGGQINSVSSNHAGGGGGSFNAGTNPNNVAGVQSGDGQVIITLNCLPTLGSLTPDAANLSDVTADCVVTALTPPTASNSCVSGLQGIPDVSLPVNTVGTTVVTWTYDDGVNTVTQQQNIVITGIDNDPPVLDNPNLFTFSNPCSFTPPTPTATDVCAGTINGVPDLTFPITTQGTNVITWTFTDNNGNSVTQQQTININDVSAPQPDVANLPLVEGCNSVTPTAPTATDNCAGVVTGTPDVTFPITTAGTTTVTWTFDDGNGNTSSQTQDVEVSLIDLTVTQNGTQLSANQTGVSYQWIDCGTGQPISGAIGQGYQPSTTGEYAAILDNGTCVDTTECVLVDFTNLIEVNSTQLTLYPNPTNTGVFTVTLEGQIEKVVVVDALGRSIELPTDLNSGEVNGASLAPGRYTVKVHTDELIYTKPLIVIE
jgi:hypothetical protein